MLDHFCWPSVKTIYIPKEDFKTNSTTKKVFRPQSGDLLAYFRDEKGHVVMVIDPHQCIAINATTYNHINGTVIKKSGVYFNRINNNKRCDSVNGIWKSWDKEENKFQVLLRLKLIDEENNKLSES